MGALKALADDHAVAIIAVHHTRKMTDDADVFNEVSGSTGLTGGADAILIAKRARNTAEAVLHVTGRDISEHDYGLSWHADTLHLVPARGTGRHRAMGSTRRRILEHLTTNPGATPQAVAETLEMPPATVRQNVRRIVDDNQLDTDGEGRYFPPLSLSQPSPMSLTRDEGDTPSDGRTPALTCGSDTSDSSDSSDTPRWEAVHERRRARQARARQGRREVDRDALPT